MEYILILFTAFFILYRYALFLKKKIKKEVISKLTDDNYAYIFSGNGDSFIAFNIQNSKFRFGKLSSSEFVERPITYISNYEWKYIGQDSENRDIKFLFYISDVNHFMHEIFYLYDEREAEIEWAKIQAVIKECTSSQYIQTQNMERSTSYDFFISHASEDKDDFVRPLVHALSNLGLKVWYDEFSLEIGDSLRRTIDSGLGNSTYGIVVLSNAFFSKQWPQYELDALVDKSIAGKKVILPIWHGLQHDEVSQYSHNLADKVAFSTSTLSVDEMASEFLKLVQRNNE